MKGENMTADTGVIILGSSFRIEPEKLTKCPCCGQTATKMQRHLFCPHCDELYKYNAIIKKQYPNIIDRLEQFAWEKYGVRVYSFDWDWHKVSCTGCLYDVPNGIIFHESNLPYDQRTVGLAHEAGHAIDFDKRFNKDLAAWSQADRFQLEQTAWDHAEELLKMFSFTDWKYFQKHKSAGLKSYEEE